MAGQSITMTATEVAKVLTSVGVKSSPTKIVNGIASGAYPFGRIINTSELRRCVEIYRVDFYAWLESKTPKG